MTTPLIEIGKNLLIGRDIARFWQNPPTIGRDESIKRLVIISQKGNQPIGIEIKMKLNSLFTKLPTVVNTSNKMEGSSADQQAQASKGAGTEAVVVTSEFNWLENCH